LVRLDPPFPEFARLRSALASTRELARKEFPRIGALSVLHPGESNAQVPAIRNLLGVLGDWSQAPPAPKDRFFYDDALVRAVQKFQGRHGLDRDGVIGAATLRQMRVPPTARVRQIELAMERLRWLPRGFGERFVLVNIPEFRLRAFKNGDQPLTMSVVVGKAARQTQTPIVRADMTYVVFRPYWEVPRKIAREEIFPKIDRDPSYLARNRMEFKGTRLRQLPGADNALGLVKFIFPNPHNVYLHDSPQRALFRRARRDFSHGCIRISEAAGLAQWVLSGQDGWDKERIRRAMQEGSDNRWVQLDQPICVYLFYSTVAVDADGRINFHEDIYGHDAILIELLEKRRVHS